MAQVRLFAAARAAAGVSELSVNAGSLAGVLAEAVGGYPGLERVLPQCSFLVDGVRATPETHVSDDSVVDVLPPFAGG